MSGRLKACAQVSVTVDRPHGPTLHSGSTLRKLARVKGIHSANDILPKSNRDTVAIEVCDGWRGLEEPRSCLHSSHRFNGSSYRQSGPTSRVATLVRDAGVDGAVQPRAMSLKLALLFSFVV